MGGRPQGSPLRRVTRGAVKRGVEDAAPYGGATRSAVGRDDVGIVPYGYITRGAVKNSPFRQGGRGTGERIATGAKRPRNDRGYYKGCGTGMQKQVSRFTHLFFILFFFKAIPHNWTRVICEQILRPDKARF